MMTGETPVLITWAPMPQTMPGIARVCIDDGTHDVTKVLSGENGWQRVEPFLERGPLRTRLGGSSARALLCLEARVRADAGKIELLVAEWHASR